MSSIVVGGILTVLTCLTITAVVFGFLFVFTAEVENDIFDIYEEDNMN